MIARCIHLVICISGGRQAERVVISLWHYRSVLLEIEAGGLIVCTWVRDLNFSELLEALSNAETGRSSTEGTWQVMVKLTTCGA